MRVIILIGSLFLWLSLTGQTCTKVIVYSKDYYTQPRVGFFELDKQTVMEALKKALDREGYSINQVDEEQGRIITGWRPVASDSHYALLFERKDYGVSDGAYYQLIADLSQQGSRIKVALSTTVKSIAGKMESSGKAEAKILAYLEDQLRSPQIEMNNVEVKKK